MLESLFLRQNGVITRSQAIDAGMTRYSITRLIESGEWEPAGRGVYHHLATPWTWEAQQSAYVLASRGLASHRAAARLWAIDGGRYRTHEISIPAGSRFRRPGLVVHESTQWGNLDPATKAGIAVTPIDRTLLDLGAVVPQFELENAVTEAINAGLTSWPKLLACLDAHAKRGRDGCGRLRRAIEALDPTGQPARSTWSNDVKRWVVSIGLPQPLLEYPVLDEGGDKIAEVDLAWPEHRLILELDSVKHHLNRSASERDAMTRNRLTTHGWTVLECTWRMWTGERLDLRRSLTTHLPMSPNPDNRAA